MTDNYVRPAVGGTGGVGKSTWEGAKVVVVVVVEEGEGRTETERPEAFCLH